MQRVIDQLNDMSFQLPQGWVVSKDKYHLMNGQGFVNCENYITQENKVVSLFHIQRNPDEFFEYYQNLVESYDENKDDVIKAKQFSMTANDFFFPVYILKGTREQTLYLVQIFVNCGDCLGCFMFNIDCFCEDKKQILSKNKIFKEVASLLRTIE